VFAHSKEVLIDFNKKVHLDHFHYRISPYYHDSNAEERGGSPQAFYIRTYDEGRLILDKKLQGNQSNWLKVTFPRSKVSIDRIVIS
jgi:hypothetical protein